MGYYSRSSWAPYVSVAKRKENALKQITSLKKKGITLNPIQIEGRLIAKTFWGKAWCENLESYSDYDNRLPRGRTYVRNGSILDLQITKGQVKAQVMGSSLYNVKIDIKPMEESKWKGLIHACIGKIDSLIELLQGKFSKSVMQIVTQKEGGLFPSPREISMDCSCPDSAGMCKHIAAVLYGVGALLDKKPELFFTLRHVDHMDLLAQATADSALLKAKNTSLEEEKDLSALFGIELDQGTPTPTPSKKKKAIAVQEEPSKQESPKKEASPKIPKKRILPTPKTALPKSKPKT